MELGLVELEQNDCGDGELRNDLRDFLWAQDHEGLWQMRERDEFCEEKVSVVSDRPQICEHDECRKKEKEGFRKFDLLFCPNALPDRKEPDDKENECIDRLD